jgi:hypothetical protein
VRLVALTALIAVLFGLTAVSMAWNPAHPHNPPGNCARGMKFSESEGMCQLRPAHSTAR